MTIHRDKIFNIQGEGILRNEKEHLEIPIFFTCSQYFNGIIEGTIELSEENQHKYFTEIYSGKEFNISAEIENTEINIEKLIISNITSELIKLELIDIKFKTNFLKLNNREITPNTNKLCKFSVSNLKSLRTCFDSDVGNVTFVLYKNEKEIWQDIENYNRSSITGLIQIILDDQIRLNSIDDYKSLLYDKIERILLLTSLAQGTFIDWASFELFEKINETDYEPVYSERKPIRNDFSSRHEIISFLQLSDFLKIVYPNYTDKLDKDQGLNFAIYWYLESLDSGILESRYIKSFTVLELLIFRFTSLEKSEYILKEDDFKELKKQLQKGMSKLLKESSFGKESKTRASLYSNLNCINKYSFEANLIFFLKQFRIGYSDLIDDLGILIRIRNNITHRGLSEIELNELIDLYDKLLTLIQRIFLSMLNYQGSYYNWSKKIYEQFNKNPNNDFEENGNNS